MRASDNSLVLVTLGPLKGLAYFLAFPFIGTTFIVLALVYRAIQGSIAAWHFIAKTRVYTITKMEKAGIRELLSDNQMQPLVEKLDCEVLIIDRYFRIAQYFRPSLYQDEPNNMAIGQYCYKFAHNVSMRSECDWRNCPVQKVMETKKRATVTHYHENPIDGGDEKRRVKILASPVRNDQGEITHVAEFIWDVRSLTN